MNPFLLIYEELPSVRIWSEWEQMKSEVAEADRIAIVVACTFTAEPLEPYLGWWLESFGVATEIRLAGFDQVAQELLSPGSLLAENKDGVNVLLLRSEEILPELHRSAAVSPELEQRCVGELDRLVSWIEGATTDSDAQFLVSNFPPALVSGPAVLTRSTASWRRILLERLNAHWTEALDAISGVSVLDLSGLASSYGVAAAQDHKMWLLARMPYADGFYRMIGTALARAIRAGLQPVKKALVLDCDNTLWGGVVGEDGADHLGLGYDPPGNAFRALQDYVASLAAQGILLCLASKNNEEDVWRVFDEHPEMLLRRKDLAAWRINWKPKSQNLAEIAEELNIGLDSVVHLDDDPREIAEIEANAPEVLGLLLPQEPSARVEYLARCWCFDRLVITAEDRARFQMMSADSQRRAVRKEIASLDDYLGGLELVAEVELASERTLVRVAQLINKTNQFNLTTIRRSESEVRSLIRSSKQGVYTLRSADRFGDYGLIGVAVVEFGTDAWSIETFLLSCRAIGRKLETAFLAAIAQHASASGVRALNARFVPTAKNRPAADFLPRHGFSEHGATWTCPCAHVKQSPPFIALSAAFLQAGEQVRATSTQPERDR